MYRSTDIGNQVRTMQELQRSAPIPSGFLDTWHLFGNKFQPVAIQRPSLEEELEQDCPDTQTHPIPGRLGKLEGLRPTTYAMMIECTGKEEKPKDPRKNDAVFTAEDHPDGSLWNDPCSPQPGYRPPAATTGKEKDLGSVLVDSHPAKSITEMKGNSLNRVQIPSFFLQPQGEESLWKHYHASLNFLITQLTSLPIGSPEVMRPGSQSPAPAPVNS